MGRLGFGRFIIIFFTGIIIMLNPSALERKIPLEYPENLYFGGIFVLFSTIVLIWKFILYKKEKNVK